jgi:hypothetical protein
MKEPRSLPSRYDREDVLRARRSGRCNNVSIALNMMLPAIADVVVVEVSTVS